MSKVYRIVFNIKNRDFTVTPSKKEVAIHTMISAVGKLITHTTPKTHTNKHNQF